ncbi:hypothetical protein ACH6EH_07270 [Paenibacillus sp. JSM ZJ436]|uniref:hypothetical protein n=1 Tax=Paenibacillus sp. JSM ZJ436 TaxID=3376190 RepID=UPI003795FEB1
MFYAIVINEKGTNMVMDNLPTDRHGATVAAEEYAKRNRLTVQGVYPVKQQQKQGQVLTKNSKQRRATLGHR